MENREENSMTVDQIAVASVLTIIFLAVITLNLFLAVLLWRTERQERRKYPQRTSLRNHQSPGQQASGLGDIAEVDNETNTQRAFKLRWVKSAAGTVFSNSELSADTGSEETAAAFTRSYYVVSAGPKRREISTSQACPHPATHAVKRPGGTNSSLTDVLEDCGPPLPTGSRDVELPLGKQVVRGGALNETTELSPCHYLKSNRGGTSDSNSANLLVVDHVSPAQLTLQDLQYPTEETSGGLSEGGSAIRFTASSKGIEGVAGVFGQKRRYRTHKQSRILWSFQRKEARFSDLSTPSVHPSSRSEDKAIERTQQQTNQTVTQSNEKTESTASSTELSEILEPIEEEVTLTEGASAMSEPFGSASQPTETMYVGKGKGHQVEHTCTMPAGRPSFLDQSITDDAKCSLVEGKVKPGSSINVHISNKEIQTRQASELTKRMSPGCSSEQLHEQSHTGVLLSPLSLISSMFVLSEEDLRSYHEETASSPTIDELVRQASPKLSSRSTARVKAPPGSTVEHKTGSDTAHSGNSLSSSFDLSDFHLSRHVSDSPAKEAPAGGCSRHATYDEQQKEFLSKADVRF
ncbi:hypothetical protein ElyMa_001708700 [Elysia marginata]|uniref:Uncharacterized protein n=1 Tax=Elysia marginata TaxID=1093978 RepID=A0AAV4JTZ6_9GAST|nr:hypothetical protein ElyMa_001708700 [Elysia marginata]